ncbi:P-loop uncharacterized protein DUF2791 [Melghirimyces profundicolus]|uniref:P-loop uncharacterized protein DUF2791 n=1 Tax=Melghirimyces profundicolus TaxID=1242148 RepID=A0A2T6B9G7_9BACL|nr:ATP-binding protein [Melghirimyces profundicolus]PTX52704.1 P-loop uncharacterized protein DUF2791 [Melghirimyces profundicolus]
MRLLKKHSNAILQSLTSGVVPRIGLDHIVVGREKEREQIMEELKHVKQGSAMVKVFIGEFGSGKSFILSMIRNLAFVERFVVADVDLTAERRLYGSEGKALSTYTELMNKLSTKTRPEGNALPVILEKWIDQIHFQVQEEEGYEDVRFDDQNFVRDVQRKIGETLYEMEELVGGFDFAKVIRAYYRGYVEDNQERMSNALRWLRGEYSTKSEARKDLGIRDIIDDLNWYEYLKVIAAFIHQVGYAGLVVNFDEAINLYKNTHSVSRDKNYETILKFFNDAYQGKAEHMYITFAGTKEFLEDERRGLFSYSALKTRLATNRFETTEFRDLSQPVIKLAPLQKEEIYALLIKIRSIHGFHHGYEPTVTDDDIRTFMDQQYARPGAEQHITPRYLIRDFISALNILRQNPNMDKQTIFEVVEKNDPKEELNLVLDRFQRTRQ